MHIIITSAHHYYEAARAPASARAPKMAAMLEAEALAAEIEAAGSGSPEMMPASETYVVVEKTYPRNYLGRAWRREELLHQTAEAVFGPFASEAAANAEARRRSGKYASLSIRSTPFLPVL